MTSTQEVIQARRTESLDAPEILKLVSATTEKLFGRVNVVNIIEKASLAVTLVNANNDVMGHAAFFDYPNLPSVDQSKWEDWLHSKYDSDKCNPLNTLFMNYFVAKSDFAFGCATEIIRTVFNAVPFLHYIFLVVPRGVETGSTLTELFKPMAFKESFTGKLNVELQVCYRHDHCAKLHIRPARVEDHDDLTPIFNRQSDVLTSTYGDFFLAELIEAQDEKNKCVVADVKGTAVGFMSVCSTVDVELLSNCFDLKPFNGLQKFQGQTPPRVLSPVKSTSPNPSEEKEATPTATDEQTLKPTDSVIEDRVAEDVKQAKESSSGEASAFCIQLFCIDEKYEMRSTDFLPAVFDLFPDKDYCILTMPHLVPEFPLLQSFVRVTPRKYSTLSQELYIFHRWGLIESFHVRPCTSADTEGIRSVVSQLNGADIIIRDVQQYNSDRRDPDGTEVQCFVAQCMDQVVGVALLRREEDIEFIRSHYNIEDFIYFNHHRRDEHSHLYHFALNPVFQQYSKHFLKEVLRLAHKSCLYYPVYPQYSTQEESKPHTTVTALNDLVPIRARRQIIYPLDQLGGNAPSERIVTVKEPYSLTHLNRKLTLEPKVTINARIVVVGASDVGISFLETLVFCPHLRFNNLTLVSNHGMPGQLTPDEFRSKFLPSSLCYTQEDFVHMALSTWVKIVEGKVIALDRTNKVVKVTGGAFIPYDYLILCTGQQFQIPVPTDADISTLVTTSEVTMPKVSRYTGPLPSTVFTINTERDCENALNYIRGSFLEGQGNALVYGNTLESFSMVQTLLALGLPGSRVVLVQPPLPVPTCFNNPFIEDAVAASLKECGVASHVGFTLAQWNDGKVDEPLSRATFTSENKPLSVNCEAFFCFQNKKVDYEAFKAINDSCLVFDGKLVIDSDFHTNDPCIRAAGPLTKFQRRYHAESWTHGNFNSKEVGAELAQSLLTLFDPTLDGMLLETETQQDQLLIPIYTKPKTVSAVLPGGYNYLQVGKPGLNIPLDAHMVQPEYGRELITGSATEPDQEQNYFRLHVNQHHSLETITCYTRQTLDISNLVCLYGLHERYLNNMVQRYDEGLISDFYSFFRESWCLAVFHDRFKDFRDEIRELLVAKPSADVPSLEDKVRKMIDEDLVLSKDQRRVLTDSYVASSAKKAIEQRLLGFLNYNSYHLPMYAKPGMV
ncbi:unnamed protein product [Porites evermanni]|uniref:Cilia- and flagella-associated protein 61 N-terminal domain-containing protein n=1 Tax=Porites evermanni TaxID=104178 RepID=A0ABN8LN82_9CNID|nr:unnamed protein product [Porites evermanni]